VTLATSPHVVQVYKCTVKFCAGARAMFGSQCQTSQLSDFYNQPPNTDTDAMKVVDIFQTTLHVLYCCIKHNTRC